MSLWPKVQLRRLFRVVNGGTPTSDAENWGGRIPWATPVDLGRRHGRMLGPTDRTLTEVGLRTGSATVSGGSLVLSTRAPVGYVAETQSPTAFNQGCRGLTPHGPIDVRFYRYALESLSHDLQAAGQGSTFVELSSDALAQQLVAMPPLAEQRAIGDFLDTETARIDALITKKRRMIDLLEERRWSEFRLATTKTDAPRVPARRALVSVTDGPFGSAFTSAEYSDDGVAVIRLGNIGHAEFRDHNLARLPLNRFAEFRHYAVRQGDVLFAGLGDERNHAGRACVAPDLGPAIVKGKCFCGRVDTTRAVPDFIALYFSSPMAAASLASNARGSTRQMINLEILKAVEVPLPSFEQQMQIVEAVRSRWGTLEALYRRLDEQVRLMQERRGALITAAVTGELEVPEVAA